MLIFLDFEFRPKGHNTYYFHLSPRDSLLSMAKVGLANPPKLYHFLKTFPEHLAQDYHLL